MELNNHPIHPAICDLANNAGVKLANRLVSRSHVFDGETIGLWWYNQTLKICFPLSDHEILHEVCHYIVADQCQKDLPEYGLGSVGSMGQKYCPRVVDIFDSEMQEFAVQILCIRYGRRHGISHLLGEMPTYCKSWDDYDLKMNKKAMQNSRTLEAKHSAEIRCCLISAF